MNNAPVTESVCAARRALNDDRFARDKERLEKTEDLIDKVTECQIPLTEIMKSHNEKIADHEKRLGEIEHRPVAWVDKFIAAVIAAVVSIAAGFFFS